MAPMRTSVRETIRVGLIIGVVALFIALIGMVEGFSERYIVSGVIPPMPSDETPQPRIGARKSFC